MSGTVADRKRIIRVTQANLRWGHLYITGHHDFFPPDVIGSNRKTELGVPIKLELHGLNKSIETDIGTEKDGSPRRHFRNRTGIPEFYKHHEIQTGDLLALERLGERSYRLYPFQTAKVREHDWHCWLETPLETIAPTVLELFAGCGGMALGFKRAGFDTVLTVEWDKAACDTLRSNITPRVAQCAIEEIDEFPKADVVIGGPPCQGFSNLGERVPYDPRRQLWRHYLRAVEQAQPKAFVMENVPPLLSSQEYVEITKAAERLGYSVDGWVLNAANYGVPQTRKRAIVIGIKGARPTPPPQTHWSPGKADTPLFEGKHWITVRDAIGDLPFEPTGEDLHWGRKPTDMSMKRYRHVPPGGNRFDLPDDLQPECWKRKTKGGTDLFGRLWWDRPSVTIRTEFYKPEKGRYLHPEADRPITHREAARLQGFPDEYAFCGSKIQVGRQIGNAVPPPLAEAIARHVMQIAQFRNAAFRNASRSASRLEA
jgi:DNA (cytosine-5)-methyltransferase 1